MINEFIKAFSLVFIAEMGDKSQFLAMTFATKYKSIQVILGVALGVVVNHSLAILVGFYISKIIPIILLQSIAGFLFIVFGIISFVPEKDEKICKNNYSLGSISTIAIIYFIGELGDKTQLTAMTLAMESKWPIVVLLATTFAMIIVATIGIFIIKSIKKSIPTYIVKIISGIVFISVGISKIYISSNIFSDNDILFAVFLIIIFLFFSFMSNKLLENNKN